MHIKKPNLPCHSYTCTMLQEVVHIKIPKSAQVCAFTIIMATKQKFLSVSVSSESYLVVVLLDYFRNDTLGPDHDSKIYVCNS